MNQYAVKHRIMLERLSIKELRRLARSRLLQARIRSMEANHLRQWAESSADQIQINKLNRQRARCESQAWAIEDIIKIKLAARAAQQETLIRAKAESNAARAEYLARNTFIYERTVKVWFTDDVIPKNHAAIFRNYGRTEIGRIIDPYVMVFCHSKKLAQECEQYALKLKPADLERYR